MKKIIASMIIEYPMIFKYLRGEMLNLYEIRIHKKVTAHPIDIAGKKDYTVVKRG